MTTEIERMAILENNFMNMKEDISEIKATLNKFIESADEKYASKMVEKVVYGMVGIILVAFVGGLLTLVLK